MAASLTSTAINTRRVIRYGIFFVIFLTFSRVVLGIAGSIYTTLVPKPPPPPTVQFGKLPNLPFAKATQEFPTFDFKIETATGSLPKFPTQSKVYLMPAYTTTLFSSDEAKKKATALGFASDPIELSAVLYRYASLRSPSALELNIVNGAFSVSYNLAADSSPLQGLPPNQEQSAVIAKTLLTSSGSIVEDLEGEPFYDFLKVEGNNLVRAVSLSESSLIRVNLTRKEIDELPAVTADPTRSNAWFILSGADERERQLIAAQYRHFRIDEKRFETYPIKTAAQALEDLKAGKGYIANLGLNKEGKVTIRNVYLAYYDPDTITPFYQPVVVFKGDGEFVAYVPAVTNEFYGEAQ